MYSLQWRHNEHDGVSNHRPRHGDCLLSRLCGRRSKKTSTLRVTGLCSGNLPMTSEFPAQRASNTENVFIWWCHHIHGSCETLNSFPLWCRAIFWCNTKYTGDKPLPEPMMVSLLTHICVTRLQWVYFILTTCASFLQASASISPKIFWTLLEFKGGIAYFTSSYNKSNHSQGYS